MYDEISLFMEVEAGLPQHATPVAVGFGLYPKQNRKATEKAGRPIFDDVEYVKIITPGEKNTVFFQPATDQHRQRFPKAYARFKAGNVVPEQGTPLEQWPAIARSQVMSFKAIGIHTVEAMAAVHDGNVEALGHGGRELREKARGYIRQAEDTAAVQKLAAEKQAMADQMAMMQRQIADLAARLEAAEGDKVPAPRPAPPRRPAPQG
jgi:hypothetical protein